MADDLSTPMEDPSADSIRAERDAELIARGMMLTPEQTDAALAFLQEQEESHDSGWGSVDDDPGVAYGHHEPVGRTKSSVLKVPISFVPPTDGHGIDATSPENQGSEADSVGHSVGGTNVPRADVPQEVLNNILNAPNLDDLTKAFLVALTQYAPEDREIAVREVNALDPQNIRAKTAEAYASEKARTEAKRLIAAETYRGSEELSWDNLHESEQSFIVQDLVPDDGVVFLVAKRNMGKTFAYIDMICSLSFGMPWLGKETRAVKVLVVLGEGRNGFIDRLRAWCNAHKVDLDSLRECLFFVDGANLNNDESIARLREVAEREEVEMILFDTWATVSGAASEDDAAMNSETMRRAESIKPGATLFFIHHPRKSEQDSDHPVMRGSGSLDGRAEVVMTIYRDRKFAPKSGENYEWLALSTDNDHGGKNRTALTETIRGLYLAEHDESAVFTQIEAEAVSKTSRKVSDLLTRPMSAKEYATIAKTTEKTGRRHLDVAVEEGVALVTPGAAANRPSIYTPTAPPRTNYAALAEMAH